MGVFKGERRIYTTAGSPGDYYSIENCMRDLTKLGYLPQKFKTQRLR